MIEAPPEWRREGVYALLADESEDRLDIWYWHPSRRRFLKTGPAREERREAARAGERPARAGGGARPSVHRVPGAGDASGQAPDLLREGLARRAARFERRRRVGLKGDFSNTWATIQGADLFYERRVDRNLRAVLTHAVGRDTEYEVWLYPKADGWQDYRYVNYDDWEVLRVNLCREVVDPGDTVSNPIRCLPKTW